MAEVQMPKIVKSRLSVFQGILVRDDGHVKSKERGKVEILIVDFEPR